MSNICSVRAMRVETRIVRLGAQGDGIAEDGGEPVYIPFTLPGERIAARIDGTRGALLEVIKPSPERIAPVCRHFGACGGCALQHWNAGRYRDWKRERVVEALVQQRIAAEVEPMLAFPAHSRRRAAFTAVRAGREVLFGFRRALSHEVIDIGECPILMPRLEAALPALRTICAALLQAGEARVIVTVCEGGLDVLIEPDGRQRASLAPSLAGLAQQAGIVRLAWRSDILFSTGPARVSLSGVMADLPPAAFLQAVPEA
jgi:23S rRNA (uracil1939-C5)-methyltransferase